MNICSRVVCIKGEYKNKTGTFMELLNTDKPYKIKLDSGECVRLMKEQLLEIDDITNAGYIDFRKGMKIYDIQFEKIGEVLEVIQFDEEIKVHKVGWEDGSISEFTLNEEFNFIVV